MVKRSVRISPATVIKFTLTFLLVILYVAAATPEFGAKESRNCDFCHVEGDYSQLNERGIYYLQNNYSFEGYVEEEEEASGGAGLYKKYCKGCHGEVPEEFRYKDVNEAVIDAIKSGRMPPWGIDEELSEDDIRELASYIGDWCNLCHKRIETNFTPRELVNAPPNHRFKLEHGNFWCFACHNPENRDTFLLVNGSAIPFNKSPELCRQCHAVIYKDWKMRIHGRWVGNISNPTPDVICVDCHNPHDVNPAFKPITPEKPPEKPPSPPIPISFQYFATAIMAFSLVLMLYSARK